MKFKELGLHEDIENALAEQGITEPTDIQSKVIPEIKKGHDIIGISKTGSGKTIAFSAPILHNIKRGEGIQILVIVPIRELAEQVAKEIRKISKTLDINITTIYGGMSLGPQANALRHADIVVGTPGRLLDHLERRSLNLSKIKVVVLDEADKMAMMGFIEDVEDILSATPKTRQTLLFGATISEDIAKLRDRHMKSPVTIKAESQVENKLLVQCYHDVESKDKFSMLVHLILKEKPTLAMIFCATRRNAEIVAKNLVKQNIHSHFIHGGMSQSARLRMIDDFHKGRPEILVATAVAARGLDIKNVSHVFNYDVPKDPEEYIHQIGRTARAGTSGKAVTLLAQHDHDLFSNVLRRYKMNVVRMPKEEFVRVPFDAGKRREYGAQSGGFNRGGRSGGRFGGRSRDGESRGGFRGERSSSGGRGNDRFGERRERNDSRSGERKRYNA
jgi:ATP-dependent RNA helicase DeaD